MRLRNRLFLHPYRPEIMAKDHSRFAFDLAISAYSSCPSRFALYKQCQDSIKAMGGPDIEMAIYASGATCNGCIHGFTDGVELARASG